MKLPSIQTATPGVSETSGSARLSRADGDGADRFRDALSLRRKAEGGVRGDDKKEAKEGATASSAAPPAPPFQPLPQPAASLHEKRFDPAATSRLEQGGAMPMSAEMSRPDNAAAVPLPTVDTSMEASSFASALARLDAGIAPSPVTQIVMTGDQWRMEQAMIAHDGQGLGVEIDLGHQGQQDSDSLEELRARLRARGLDATVHATPTEPGFPRRS